MALNQVVGVVVVYRTGMLAVTGSKHGKSFFLFTFCFLFFYLVPSFRVNSWFGLRSFHRFAMRSSSLREVKIVIFERF